MKMMARSMKMMARSMWKINKSLIIAFAGALLLCAVHCSNAVAAERGLFDTSSLSGLSDLLTLLGDKEQSSSASSSAQGSSDTSGLLQEVLELLGVAGEIPIKDVTVSKIEDREYTGKEIKPVPKLTYNGKTLKRGSDFSLSYTDNIKTGTAKVKITGKGSYKGTRTVSFHIVKKDAKSGSSSGTGTKKGSGTKKESGTTSAAGGKTTSKKFTVKLSVASYEYNGSERKPSVKVTVSGKAVPASGYTISYSRNKNVGTATVTVKGKGDYKGYTGSATFRITLKKVTVSSVKSTSAGTLTVTWKSDSQADGYQLEYCTNKSFSGNVKKKQLTDSKTLTCTIDKLNSSKNYYVRMRSYKKTDSRNSYGPWSTVKNAKVK